MTHISSFISLVENLIWCLKTQTLQIAGIILTITNSEFSCISCKRYLIDYFYIHVEVWKLFRFIVKLVHLVPFRVQYVYDNWDRYIFAHAHCLLKWTWGHACAYIKVIQSIYTYTVHVCVHGYIFHTWMNKHCNQFTGRTCKTLSFQMATVIKHCNVHYKAHFTLQYDIGLFWNYWKKLHLDMVYVQRRYGTWTGYVLSCLYDPYRQC